MLIAQVNNERVKPSKELTTHIRDEDSKLIGYSDSKGNVVTCPSCNENVQPKLGSSITHHFAHLKKSDCIANGLETEWHRQWKSFLPINNIEIIIGNNRADIVTLDKIVIELQHSYISSNDISERNKAYKKGTPFKHGRLSDDCFWFFDCNEYKVKKYFTLVRDFKRKNKITFYQAIWKRPRKPWMAVENGHLLIDFEDGIVFVAHRPLLKSGKYKVYIAVIKKDLFKEYLKGNNSLISHLKGINNYLTYLINSDRSGLYECNTCGLLDYGLKKITCCVDYERKCKACLKQKIKFKELESCRHCKSIFCNQHTFGCKHCGRSICDTCEFCSEDCLVFEREEGLIKCEFCKNGHNYYFEFENCENIVTCDCCNVQCCDISTSTTSYRTGLFCLECVDKLDD